MGKFEEIRFGALVALYKSSGANPLTQIYKLRNHNRGPLLRWDVTMKHGNQNLEQQAAIKNTKEASEQTRPEEPVWAQPIATSSWPKTAQPDPAQETSNIWLTTSSACLLLATVSVAGIYWYIFGIHLIGGDSPDHWNWLGGLVGLFAVIIRLIVILVVAIPYVTMSVLGLSMSMRVFSVSKGAFAWVNGFLATGHGIMLLPAAYVSVQCLIN